MQSYLAASPIAAPTIVNRHSAAILASTLGSNTPVRVALAASAATTDTVAVFVTSDSSISATTLSSTFNAALPSTWPAGCQLVAVLTGGAPKTSAFDIDPDVEGSPNWGPYVVVERVFGTAAVNVEISGETGSQVFLAASPIAAPTVVNRHSASILATTIGNDTPVRVALAANAATTDTVAIFATSSSSISATTLTSTFNSTLPSTWPPGCQLLAVLTGGNPKTSAYDIDPYVEGSTNWGPYLVIERVFGTAAVNVQVSGNNAGDNDITNGGNSFGVPIIIGSLDAQPVSLIVAGTVWAIANSATSTVFGIDATGAMNQFGTITGGSSTSMVSGTGGTNISSTGTGQILIAAGDTAQCTIRSGRLSGDMVVDLGSVANTTGVVRVGGGAWDHATIVGSLTGASRCTIQAGSSGVTVAPASGGPVAITLTGAADLVITPGATGSIILQPRGAGANDTATIKFNELAASGTNYIGLQAPDSVAADLTFKLPGLDGNAGSSLRSNGSAALGFVSSTAEASNTSGQSIVDAAPAAILTGWTAILANGSFVVATGLYTTPATGFYTITASVQFTAAVAVLAAEFRLHIVVGGTVKKSAIYTNPVAALSVSRQVTVTAGIQLTVGDVVDIRAFQNSGGAIALTGTAANNFVSFALTG